MERVLQDSDSNNNRRTNTSGYLSGSLPRTRSRSFEPKVTIATQETSIDAVDQRSRLSANEFEDGELTLDDLESKFSIDDIHVNNNKQTEVAFKKLSASLNSHDRNVIRN